MKVFVSSQISEVDKVRNLYKELEVRGHQITHDWTSIDTDLRFREAKLNNKLESGRRAKNDIQGVVDCDVYILLTDNKEMGKGMYVELGAALGLQQKTGSPRMYIVGPLNHISIFYLHPSIVHLDTTKEFLETIDS